MVKLKVRTVDELGRVVLPKNFRQSQGWEEGTKIAIYQDQETLIIKLADRQEEPDNDE